MKISNGVKKLEKFLFYFFVFSIPFQTRKILFLVSPASPAGGSAGKFIEWNSGFLYFTDLLIVAIIFLAFLRGAIKFKKADIFLGLFFLIVILSLITSQNIGLSIYQFIKLAEFLLLFLYVRTNLEFLGIEKILKIFVVSGGFQALIATLQFFNQSSLGLKHIEAGVYNANIPGVATFFVNGIKFIRAYGTAPHPNVLAVFLLVSIFCLYAIWLKENKSKNYFYFLFSILYFLLFLGLFLTFSRAIIMIFFGASLLFFFVAFLKFKEKRPRLISLILLFAICNLLFITMFWPEFKARFLGTSLEEQAVTLRVYYNNIAILAIKEKPISGLGLGNFVWYLLNNYNLKEFWLYQPVHNIYLLIASEIGIFGLIMFLIFLGRILLIGFRRIFRLQIFFIFYFLFFIFLALAMIDHYFWTIQQSRFLFWIVLALIDGLIVASPRSLTDKAQASGA